MDPKKQLEDLRAERWRLSSQKDSIISQMHKLEKKEEVEQKINPRMRRCSNCNQMVQANEYGETDHYTESGSGLGGYYSCR